MNSPRLAPLLAFAAVPALLVAAVPMSLHDADWFPILALGLWLTTTAGVGALVWQKQPQNAVGSLLLGVACTVSLLLFVTAYATYGFEQAHEGLPLLTQAAWLSLWLGPFGFGLLIHVFLRFPTGLLLGERWRWVSRITTLGLLTTCAGYAFREGPIDSVPSVDNPLGGVPGSTLFTSMGDAGQYLIFLGALGALLSLILRFRRSHSMERQQMRWFVLAGALLPFILALSQFVSSIDRSEEEYLGFVITVLGFLLLPVSMGVGILKYRLYDIDVVVNKTLVYISLTAILTLAYLGIVVVLQSAIDPITQESDLAIAASTLAVAALFRPVRSRLQTFIDRRFYRHKYDAAATMDGFTARMRDEVDLESLSHDLVQVVRTTMQPTHAFLWVRTRT